MHLLITTSNRLDLFRQTMASFGQNVRDKALLGGVRVFDDGSPLEDTAQMNKAVWDALRKPTPVYRWDKVYGHLANMNRIYDEYIQKTNQEFVCFWEDDWTVKAPCCPLLAALDILYTLPRVGQVCLGRDYPWLLPPQATPTGTRYSLMPDYTHENRLAPFTLNPSVMRVSALREVGRFLGGAFEYNYGVRWTQAGWQTAHLVPGLINHEGNGKSAYTINGTQR